MGPGLRFHPQEPDWARPGQRPALGGIARVLINRRVVATPVPDSVPPQDKQGSR